MEIKISEVRTICFISVLFAFVLIINGCTSVEPNYELDALKKLLIAKENGDYTELTKLLSTLDTARLGTDMLELVAFEKTIQSDNSKAYFKTSNTWGNLLKAIYAKETQDERYRITYLNDFLSNYESIADDRLVLIYTISLLYEKGLVKNFDLNRVKSFYRNIDIEDPWLSTYYKGYQNLTDALVVMDSGDYTTTQVMLMGLFAQLNNSEYHFPHLESIVAYYIYNTANNNGEASIGDRYFHYTQLASAVIGAREKAVILKTYVDFDEKEIAPGKDIFDSFIYTCQLAETFMLEMNNETTSLLTLDMIEDINVETIQPAEMASLMQLKGSTQLRIALCEKLLNVDMSDGFVGFAGYQIEILRNLLNANMELCNSDIVSSCESATSVLDEILALWLRSGYDKDPVHNSDFISGVGLTELAIYHGHKTKINTNPRDIIDIHLRCKNRMIQRSVLINEENYLSKEDKIQLDKLNLALDQLGNELGQLPDVDFVSSDLHQQRMGVHNEIKEILKYEDDREINSIIDDTEGAASIWANAIKHNLQIIDLIYDDEFLYLLHITPDTVDSHQIELKVGWQDELSDFQLMIKDQNTSIDSIKVVGRSIWNEYFEELIDTKYPDLVVVNTGVWNNISFGALAAKNERYLNEQFNISYIPNLSFVNKWETEDITLNNASILSFTDTGTLDGEGSDEFPELVFGFKEAASLKAKLPLDKIEFTSGLNLTRDNFIQSMNTDLVHIATHASSSTNNKYGNYFAVREEGKVEQLYGFELSPKAKLIVINSCESNIGTYLPGEGIFSMTNQFMTSTTANIVSTNFKINDQASEYFMELFYNELLKNGKPGIAIGSAQKVMSKDDRYGHPKYWAAYTYHGNPNCNFQF